MLAAAGPAEKRLFVGMLSKDGDLSPPCIWIIRKLFEVFKSSYIKELELCANQFLSFLVHFTPYSGKMQYLCKLQLTSINSDRDIILETLADKEKNGAKSLSQFSKLNHLRHFCVNDVYFSNDNMKDLFT